VAGIATDAIKTIELEEAETAAALVALTDSSSTKNESSNQ
jgi:hypothetical protein